MSEGKHTPGEWSIGPPNIIKAVTAIQGGDRQTRWVAMALKTYPEIDGECEANARLIAAAPDLLTSLRYVLDAFDDDGDHRGTPELECVQRARSALAKAEGRE